MSRAAIIVPCRLESTRFPRKLLHRIRDKPLLLWVAERIAAQVPDMPLYFAVDHELLGRCVESGGFKAIMTRSDHASGTDRIAQANRKIGAEHVINVQADEPPVSAGADPAAGGIDRRALRDGHPGLAVQDGRGCAGISRFRILGRRIS